MDLYTGINFFITSMLIGQVSCQKLSILRYPVDSSNVLEFECCRHHGSNGTLEILDSNSNVVAFTNLQDVLVDKSRFPNYVLKIKDAQCAKFSAALNMTVNATSFTCALGDSYSFTVDVTYGHSVDRENQTSLRKSTNDWIIVSSVFIALFSLSLTGNIVSALHLMCKWKCQKLTNNQVSYRRDTEDTDQNIVDERNDAGTSNTHTPKQKKHTKKNKRKKGEKKKKKLRKEKDEIKED